MLYERYMASTMEVLKHEHDTLIEMSLRCLIEMSLRAVTCMVALVDVNTWNHGYLFHAPFLTTLTSITLVMRTHYNQTKSIRKSRRNSHAGFSLGMHIFFANMLSHF